MAMLSKVSGDRARLPELQIAVGAFRVFTQLYHSRLCNNHWLVRVEGLASLPGRYRSPFLW
jgi:hypothetical protein